MLKSPIIRLLIRKENFWEKLEWCVEFTEVQQTAKQEFRILGDWSFVEEFFMPRKKESSPTARSGAVKISPSQESRYPQVRDLDNENTFGKT